MRLHPDFMIIGGPRSGTTFLYDLLKQHPEIYLRDEKRPEPHFFALDSRFGQGIQYYYDQVFSGYAGQQISGEASTTMLYCLDAIEKIKAHNPNIKLICYFRDPVSRMISEYNRSVESGWEKEPFQRALELEAGRMEKSGDEYYRTFRPGAYRWRGRYANFVEPWLAAFGRNQCYFGLTTDLIQRTGDEVGKVLQFLDVQDDFAEELVLNRADKNASVAKTNVSAKEVEELREYYREDNIRLSTLTGLDLKEWNPTD